MDKGEVMKSLSKIPPEKYYEACITYHLVNEFKERFGLEIYPFSISQTEEAGEGYDFGYLLNDASFVLQYKRPYVYSNGTFYWKIEREQLNTIISNSLGLKSYYALPAFSDINQWFQGFESSYFAESNQLNHYLKKKDAATPTINSNAGILKKGADFFETFHGLEQMRNLAYKARPVTLHDITKLSCELDEDIRNTMWIYLIREYV